MKCSAAVPWECFMKCSAVVPWEWALVPHRVFHGVFSVGVFHEVFSSSTEGVGVSPSQSVS